MAGNYPDPIGNRMAYDRDGTLVITKQDGTRGQFTRRVTGTFVTRWNDEDMNYGGDPNTSYQSVRMRGRDRRGGIVLLFPELRDISGVFLAAGSRYSTSDYDWTVTTVRVSSDTTNGVDGTWTQFSTFSNPIQVTPNYRSSVQSLVALGVRAISFENNQDSFAGSLGALHVYGSISPGQSGLNRLAVWHPTSDSPIPPAHLDFGDTPRSSSADKIFRIKNLSDTYLANDVEVNFEAITNTTPSVPGQYLLSLDGSTFQSAISVGDLSPGAISPPVILRRVTPSNAVLSVWTFRLIVDAQGGWS